MKKSRIWLVLLMALILPFKGAMAAAGMFCHSDSVPAADAAQAADHHAAAEPGQPAEHHGHGAAQPNDASTEEGRLTPTSSSCTICSAVCASPPLPASAIHVVSPAATAGERFPPLAVPRASAVVGGLERPPRTI